jgi:hypothetical protein
MIRVQLVHLVVSIRKKIQKRRPARFGNFLVREIFSQASKGKSRSFVLNSVFIVRGVWPAEGKEENIGIYSVRVES